MRAPGPMPAQTGATWLCSEQQTTGNAAMSSGKARPSSRCGAANCSGVYGSFITCASGSTVSSSPRVRFAYRTSKPPLPSSSSRAWTLTITSSPSATGPVSRGYATHGVPSTSMRASPSTRSTIAETRPRLSVSIARYVHERERDLDHPLEVADRDPLVRGVDVLHAVREVEARETALVEHVRVSGTAAEPVVRLVAAALERSMRIADDLVVTLEPVAAIALRHLRLDLAVLEPGREGEGVDHLLDEIRELALVVGPRFRVEGAPLWDDVP